MAEIHINPDDIELFIKSYKEVNKGFVLINYAGKASNKRICSFSIDRVSCRIEIYIKKNTVNIVAVGANKEKASQLIEFLKSKGYSASDETKQFSLPLTESRLQELLSEINGRFGSVIQYSVNGNIYRFEGYNKDYVTLNVFPSTNKAMIQGRPHYVFNIIMSILSDFDEIPLENIIDYHCVAIDLSVPHSAIREAMRSKLGDAYNYLDEPLLKSISGALCQQRSMSPMEDYTGCVIGVFKALEGYLSKLLTGKFLYRLDRHDKFKMFYKTSGQSCCDVESNSAISPNDKNALLDLYRLYKNKRNVYAHATADPIATRIIESKNEAIEISDEILEKIKTTYSIIMGD